MDILRDSNIHPILDNLDGAIILTDTAGIVQSSNSAVIRILGMSELELKGQNIFENLVFYQHNQKIPLHTIINTVKETNKPYILNYPTIIHDRASTEHYAKVSIFPLISKSVQNKLNGFAITIYDYTEKYLLNQELQRNLRLKSISRLLSGLAHDFNNIFTTILGNVSLAKLEIPQEGDLFNLLQDAEKGIDEARQMTKQLLTFSAEEQKEKELVEFSELLSEIVKFTLSGSKITADINLDPDLWPIYINKTQISLLFHQIIINSIQAMPIGGSIEIKASNLKLKDNNPNSYKSGDYILIEFQDHGIGVPEEELPYIFDPFYQSEYISQDVNLSTVKNIVDQHFGYIEAYSKLGQGLRFKIYLPAEPLAHLEVEEIPMEKRQYSGKVLIMDDEEVIRKILKKMLSQLGFEVFSASNSEEAVKIYEEHLKAHDPFKIVILDLTIKGGEGGALTLRQLLRLNPSVKAIASSGYATDKIIVHYQDYGFSGSLVKPYKMEELEHTLAKIL